MSAFPGGGFSASSSSSATAGDKQSPFYNNTPVAVIAGNQGSDISKLVDSVTALQSAQNEPIERAIAEGPGALSGYGSASIPKWFWYAAGAVVILILLKKHRGGAK